MIAHAARRLAAAVAALVLLAVTLVAVGPQSPNVPFGPQAAGAQERAGGEPGARDNRAPDAAIRERAATADATRGPGARAAESRGPGERADGDFKESNTCLEQENNVLFLFDHTWLSNSVTPLGVKNLISRSVEGLLGTNSRVTVVPFASTTPHNSTYQMSGSTRTQQGVDQLIKKVFEAINSNDGTSPNWAGAFQWARENAPATGWDSIVFIGTSPPWLSVNGETGIMTSRVDKVDLDSAGFELARLMEANPGANFMPVVTDYLERDSNRTQVYNPFRRWTNGEIMQHIFGGFATRYQVPVGRLATQTVYDDVMERIKPWCLNVSTELVDGTGQSYDAAEDSTIDIETAPPLKISPGRASAGTFENRIEDSNSTTPLLPNYGQMRTNNQGKVGGHLYATEGKPGRFTLRPQLSEDIRFYADNPMTCRATTLSNADDAGARQARTREVGTLSKGPRGEPVMTIDSKPGESIECTVRTARRFRWSLPPTSAPARTTHSPSRSTPMRSRPR
ncbi:hypothetical protein CATYP_05460 [Corynebacterium atypicum]|uniref:VWFA domain-containing protein n=1 Tax=Corynebacterium atypicum TaxID=191610 RepID=A0ABM5QMT5_9CORY|nr:hypothetical protein [Corynebacterium atypicum]AIG64157.1 hypothetical protein CATYP_05460 [Corynebacterium atypicum]